MALNKFAQPYFDDYNEDLNFHQIMFKPGMAVQSRELTQVQTILQNQTKRFGDAIFKDGALVTGGAQFVESVAYIKISASTVPTTQNLENHFAVAANGSVYRIKTVAVATETDPYTLFCVPITNTNGTPIAVAAGDVLTIKVQYTDAGSLGAMTVGATDPIGKAVFFNVDTGVYYTNGYFVRSLKSSVCVSKYTANPTAIVGFDVVERFVTTEDTELGGDTLLDPAQGSYNYAAPGADRYRIDLVLRVIPVTDISSPVTTSSAFIELNRIVDGQASKRAYANQYSLIGDTMARRTYDESGDYVVNDFGFRLELNTSDDYFDAVIQPGKAYIKGYEIETLVPQRLAIPKARTTATTTGYDIPAYYGNYVIVSNVAGGSGAASMFDITNMETVSFYSSTTPGAGNKVGTARVKSIEWISGTDVSAKFKLYVTDVVATGNLLDVKSVANLAYSSFTVKGDIDVTGITNIIGNTTFASGVSSIVASTPTPVVVGMSVSGTGIQAGTVVTSVNASTIGLSLPTNAISLGTVTFSATNFYDSNYDRSIFRIPHSNIASVSNLEYAVRRNISMTIVTGVGSSSLSVSGERFKDVSSDANIRRHYVAIVSSKTTGALTVGTILNVTTSGAPTMSLNVGSTTLTLDTGDATFNGTVDIIASIDIQSAPLKTKTLSVTPKQKTLGAGLYVPGTVYSLGYADVNRLIAVYESVDSNPATTSSTNITSRFILNKNFKDAFYDHSTIDLTDPLLAPVNPILVVFEVLEHSAGHGYFSADSYPVYNDIPVYTDNLGKTYDLRDCVDFRPKRADDAAATMSAYSSTFSLVGQQNIDTIYNFANADYSYYLSRIDKVVLLKNGNLGLLSGIPSLNSPQEPMDSDSGMTIAVLKIPAYTESKDDVVTKLIKNRRYTMKDVGKLDDRISRLEYYSTLNELEKEIVNTTFTTPSNEVLFNSGFIVDNFRGHGIGNVNHPDYKCSIDFANNILRPRFKANAAQWIMNGGVNSLGYVSQTKFAMLPLNTTTPEVAIVTQTVASKTLSVNPFNVQSFVGTLRLLPDRDIWYNTTKLPEIVTDEANDGAAVQAGVTGTQWGEWTLASQTMSGYNEVKTFTRSGEQTAVEAKTVVRSTKTDVVGTTFSYVMRDQDIEYVVYGLRPNTPYSVFMDGINISGPSVLQYNTNTLAYDISALKTDAEGHARGVIKVRDNVFTTFKAGKKLIQVSDGFYSPTVATTYAEAIFYSEGKTTVEQTSKVMGVDYVTVKRSITDTKIESRDTYVPPTYNPPTPAPAPAPTPEPEPTSNKIYHGSTLIQTPNTLDILAAGANISMASGGAMTNAQAVGVLDNYPIARWDGTPSLPSDADSLGHTINQAITYGLDAPSGSNVYNAAAVNAAKDFISSGAAAAALGREPSVAETALLIAAAATTTKTGAEIIADSKVAIDELATTGQVFNGYTSGGHPILCQGDPTAQTFFITADNPDGVFVSSIDTFFSHKDPSGTIPITLELRPTVNGYPDSYKIIPGSVVVKSPSEVVIPTGAQVNNPPPTTWTFENPIHLMPGEYSIVLKSDSSDYFVYVAEIGGKKLGTDETISSQQTLGSYFASQNATTWTADQNLDLMFTIRRASFQTDVELTSVFDLGRAKNTYGVGIDSVYDMFNLNASYGQIDGKTRVKFEASTKSMLDVPGAYTEIIPGNDIFPGYRSKHYVTGDTKLRVTMSTNDEKLSPFAEIFPSGFIMVENIINNGDIALPDTLPIGSGSDAVYITKPYVLQEGFDASSARVFLLENIPSGSGIEVYMKGLSGNDSSNIQDLNWIPMVRKTPGRIPANFYEYYDAEYGIDDFSYSTYNNFRAVMFKVVLKASDPSRAPSAKKFRAIALA